MITGCMTAPSAEDIQAQAMLVQQSRELPRGLRLTAQFLASLPPCPD